MALSLPQAVLADPAYAGPLHTLRALVATPGFAASPYLTEFFEWRKENSWGGQALYERPSGAPVTNNTPREAIASLSVIGTISRHNLAVGPGGNFKPHFNGLAAKAKYVALLERPAHPVYASAWDSSIENLHNIEHGVCDDSVHFFGVDDNGQETVRLTQPMFQVKGKPLLASPRQTTSGYPTWPP
ncbi:hypothetical protein B0H12DRAFT_1237797 [Mycena haematopus]|nr:hypothetical protein B0H12DRAFT_1237797 [Mycena haematopus]